MTPATCQRLAQAFREVVGPDGVITCSDERRVYECDALTTHHRAMPDIVVLPASTEQVAAVVRRCAKEDIPIVPRGAGTGLSGGAIPVQGGVLIVLTRMDRVLDIDVANRTATVEAGCVNLAINRAVMPRGFFFAPDPYALQGGREVRVVVEPEKVDDATADQLAHDIGAKIQREMEYPGQIKVTVIREYRAVSIAK